MVGKLIDSEISPFAITAWRFLLGGIILIPLALREIKDYSIKIKLPHVFSFVIIGILVVCISMLFLQLSVYHGKASLSALLVSTNPIFVTLFAYLFLHEKINTLHLIGLLIGMVGLILIVAGERTAISLSSNVLWGILFGLGAAITFGIYTVYSKHLILKTGNFTTLSFSFIFGSLILFAYSALSHKQILFHISVYNVLMLLYLSVFVTGIAYLLYFKAVKEIGAARASFYFFLKPAVAVFLAWLIHAEVFLPIQLVGMILIIISLSKNAIIQILYIRKPVVVKDVSN